MPRRVDRPHRRARSGRGASAALALVLILGACGGERPEPQPTPPTPSASPAFPAASVPTDGVTLADMGFTNGPRESFSLPRTVVVTTRVDQPNTVTLVLGPPPPAEVAGYLRRALPAAGFAITADDQVGTTLTFLGNGWAGSFTGTGSASAVSLRPA